MVKLKISSPPEKLSKYISRVLFVKSNGNTEHFQKVVSNPFVYLSFVPNNRPLPIVANKELPIEHNLYFTGPIIDQDVVLKYSGKIEHLFYEFTPIGFYSLFHNSPSRFLNTLISFHEIIGNNKYEKLQGEFNSAKTISQQKRIIEKLLIDKSKSELPIKNYVVKALNIIEKFNGYIPVKQIAEQVEVSERQLRRQFKEVVGLPTKTYCEVLSSHYIITCMQNKDSKSIQDLANSSKFYDLPHFCNRFKKIMGFSPSKFINSDIVDFSKALYSVRN